MLLSSSNHDLGDQPVRLRPGVGQVRRPRGAEELLQGREEAGPDRGVVLGYHRETTVVSTQLLEQRYYLVDLVDVGDDCSQSSDQLVPRTLHLDREHRARLVCV